MQRAPFHPRQTLRHGVVIVALALLGLAAAPLSGVERASAGTLDRIKQTGKLTVGYRDDARPFAFKGEDGKAGGYGVMLCDQVATQLKADQGLSALTVEWVPVGVDDQFRAIQDGKIDLLCGAPETLASRKDVDFSIPIFPGGIGALLRADAPVGLREVLSGQPAAGPFWRGYPAQILTRQIFSAVAGTPSEKWLNDKLGELGIEAKVVPVKSYEEGVQAVLNGGANVFFADRSILLETAKRSPAAANLMVLDRQFSYAPIALALARGDPDFRLAVDRALSQIFVSKDFNNLYTTWFGQPNANADAFFRLSVLPE